MRSGPAEQLDGDGACGKEAHQDFIQKKKCLFTVYFSSPHPYPRSGTQPAPKTSRCLVLETGALETCRRPTGGNLFTRQLWKLKAAALPA